MVRLVLRVRHALAFLLVMMVFLATSGAVLAGESPTTAKAKPKQILLIGQGPDGHKPTTHEFMAGIRIINKLLEPIEGIETKIVQADEPWTDGPKLLENADAIVVMVNQGAKWMQIDPQRHQALKDFSARGGAIVCLHWSVGARDAKYIQGQLKLLGGTRGGKHRKYTEADADVAIVNKKHPIMTGVNEFRVYDEFYYRLDLMKDDPGFQPLLRVRLEGNEETVCWAYDRPDGGRSFGYVGIHFHRTWRLPEYRRFVIQGILWTLKMEVPEGGVSVKIDPIDLQLPVK